MLPLMLAECEFCNTSSVDDVTCCAVDSQHMCPFPVQHSEAHNINACAAECLMHSCFLLIAVDRNIHCVTALVIVVHWTHSICPSPVHHSIPTTSHQNLQNSSKASLCQSGMHAHVLPSTSSKTQQWPERSTD